MSGHPKPDLPPRSKSDSTFHLLHPTGPPPLAGRTDIQSLTSSLLEYIIMKKLISETIATLLKGLGMINRAVNATDAILETVEEHALSFRDTELADLKANESDNLKQYRAAKLAAPTS